MPSNFYQKYEDAFKQFLQSRKLQDIDFSDTANPLMQQMYGELRLAFLSGTEFGINITKAIAEENKEKFRTQLKNYGILQS